ATLDNNPTRATRFLVLDGKKPSDNASIILDTVPQDEKYHWYKFKYSLNVGPGDVMFWGLYGFINIKMPSIYVKADGVEGINDWNIWFSAKFTGPAYVPGSKLENAIWVDRVVAVRKGAKKSVQKNNGGTK
ncbi:MAG: hypothetical protein IKA32_11235, partial [Lentisphaeria bacterium]|nr:hypothetical protein [Lentisphaeria bacterium]